MSQVKLGAEPAPEQLEQPGYRALLEIPRTPKGSLGEIKALQMLLLIEREGFPGHPPILALSGPVLSKRAGDVLAQLLH